MLNDFWFLKYDFAPHDPEVEASCSRHYQRPWHFHWIFYLFVGVICWPLALFILLIDFIRLNKAAYYNAQVYNAAYYGKPFNPPGDSRILLYVVAGVVVTVIGSIIYFMGPA